MILLFGHSGAGAASQRDRAVRTCEWLGHYRITGGLHVRRWVSRTRGPREVGPSRGGPGPLEASDGADRNGFYMSSAELPVRAPSPAIHRDHARFHEHQMTPAPSTAGERSPMTPATRLVAS